MLAATDYPLLNIFWSMILLFLWIAWFWLLIVILADVFRRDDISAFLKVLWVIFLIVVPFLGVFVYIVAQGRGMSERNVRRAQATQQVLDEYVRTVATTGGGGSASAEIAHAKELLDSGAITPEEFEQIKRKALA